MAGQHGDESLEIQLARVRETARARRTPEAAAALESAIAEWERTVVAGALDVGDAAPDFTLKRASDDAAVNLRETLARGPVVLSFYRGEW
jgi:hypothetical protein